MANDNNGVVACVERATSETLISPDWAINLELCDRINMEPGQAKDALKVLKKKLGSKNPKIQLLALFVLETLSKNCGENVFQQIAERDILHDMVKIVKKKPDLNVREKILILIDTWQEAFGGPGGRYPQYYAAYNELKSAGVEFPPREGNSVLLFTPPQAHSIVRPISSYEEVAIQASLQTDTSSGLSLSEIVTAQGLADVLMDMLNALDPYNKMAVKEELIVDLVDQCRSNQNRVMTLVGSTSDEELLSKGLALNDTLMRVLRHHDDIATGEVRGPENPTAPLLNDEPLRVSPIAPPPTLSTNPFPTASTVDFLSGEVYNSSGPSKPSKRHVKFAEQPSYNEPTRFTNSAEFGSSYDELVSQTRDISINNERSSTKNEKREDLLFQDLVDFAKAKSTSSSNPNRSF